MKTNKDLKIVKGSYSAIPDSYVFVPKGSAVEKKEQISGTDGRQVVYFIRPSAISNSFDRHDAIYYGLRVEEKDIDFNTI